MTSRLPPGVPASGQKDHGVGFTVVASGQLRSSGDGVSWLLVLRAYFDEARKLVVLAAPLALAQLVQAGMAFVDTVMVGRLGGGELAGMALGATTFMFTNILLMGVIFAVGPMVSQAYGAGRQDDAGRAARQGLWLAVMLAAPAAVLLHNADALLLMMGQQPQITELAGDYLRAASWGVIPAMLLVALRGFLEGVGDTRPILLMMVLGLAANVALDELLMFGRMGLPALGVAGTGHATAFVHLLMALLAALYVARYHRGFGVLRGLRGPDPHLLGQLFRLGAPIGLTMGFEAGLFALTALLMGLIGDVELAAHQIAVQASTMTFTVAVGLSIGASVRVGQAVGRNDEEGARRAGYVGMALCALVMSGSALLFWLAPELVIGIFLDRNADANLEIVRFAAVFLGVAAVFQVFDGIQVSAAGSLRGYKDTTVPMLISLVSYWVVGIGSGVLLAFGLGWGGRGLWSGLVLGLATAAILLLLRFRRRSRVRGPRDVRIGPVAERRS